MHTNTHMHFLKQIAAILVLLLVVDAAYISTIYSAFGKMIQRVQGSPLSLNIMGAIVCYAALTGVLYYFIVKPKRPATDAAILGAAIYAVYESTNYATLKGWDYQIATIDTLWGGALFYIVTSLVYFIGL